MRDDTNIKPERTWKGVSIWEAWPVITPEREVCAAHERCGGSRILRHPADANVHVDDSLATASNSIHGPYHVSPLPKTVPVHMSWRTSRKGHYHLTPRMQLTLPEKDQRLDRAQRPHATVEAEHRDTRILKSMPRSRSISIQATPCHATLTWAGWLASVNKDASRPT